MAEVSPFNEGREEEVQIENVIKNLENSFFVKETLLQSYKVLVFNKEVFKGLGHFCIGIKDKRGQV